MRTAIIFVLHLAVIIPATTFVVAGTIDLIRNWGDWA